MRAFLSVLFCLLLLSCSKTEHSEETSIVAKIGNQEITYKEATVGIEDIIYKSKKSNYENIKANIKNLALKKIVEKKSDKGAMGLEEYIEKKILPSVIVSDKEVDDFAQSKMFSPGSLNEEMREQIRQYLMNSKKREALEKWLEEELKSTPLVYTMKEPTPPLYSINTKDSFRKGSEKAAVEIVEFSDFECPFCAQASKVLDNIQKKYPNDVSIVFKNYPLPNHDFGKKAAIGALCAGEENKFWEYHDFLFENQKELSNEKLKEGAKNLSLDLSKFEKCLNNTNSLDKIEQDIKEGTSLQVVRGTPTIFINKKLLLLEEFSEEMLTSEIDAILKK